MSKYCNKGIKIIYVQAIFVTFCQLWKWFSKLRELWKATIPKKLPKPQEFTREISGVELCYRQTIFFFFFIWQFTRIIFHGNLNGIITSNNKK